MKYWKSRVRNQSGRLDMVRLVGWNKALDQLERHLDQVLKKNHQSTIAKKWGLESTFVQLQWKRRKEIWQGTNPLRISIVVSPPISIKSERRQELTPAVSPSGGVFIADKIRRNLYCRSIISCLNMMLRWEKTAARNQVSAILHLQKELEATLVVNVIPILPTKTQITCWCQ